MFFEKKRKAQLPPEEVFQKPPLEYYVKRIFPISTKKFYEIRLKEYVNSYEQLSKEWQPDLIHAHSANIGGLVASRLKKRFKIPYVITEHMPFTIHEFNTSIQPKIRESFLNASKVLSISYDKVRQLGMSGIDIDLNLVYNLVNESQFPLKQEVYSPGKPLRIINIGAAHFIKDHLTMLKALKVLKDLGVPFELTIIGLKAYEDNQTYGKIISYIKDNGLDECVNIIGLVSREEIPSYLQANDIFILSSVAEGLPVSVLEAMCTGLTVVATKHGGTEDILNKEFGVLVKIKDYKSIANNLLKIYKGELKFEPKAIREYIITTCGREAFSERVANYYEQSISE